MHSILAMGLPIGGDWVIIAIVCLILFRKRLPEISRSLGRGVAEFKKGLREIDDNMR